MDGFVNIYKPKGITSFDVIRFLRKQIGVRKIGHIGTLDPAAEGVLVVAIGQATKLIEFMMDHDKKYRAIITLGKKSTTYDGEGEISNVSNQKIVLKEIEKVVNSFVGEIRQVPPIFSALKIDGKRAYKRARAGEEIEMKERKVKIYSIDIINYKYPNLELEIYCGKGTYIRSIANDIGEKLKIGAYLSYLKRTAIDNFLIKNSHTFEDIEINGVVKYLLPIKRGVAHLYHINLTHQEYKILKNGGFVEKKIPKDIAICAAIFNNDLVGIIEKARGKNLIKFKKQFIL